MAAYSSYGAMSLALPCSKGQQHLQQQQRQEGHFRLWFEAPSSEKQVSAPCLFLPVEPVSLTNLRNMCRFGDLDEAVQTLALLDRRGFPVSRDTFYSLLLECTRKKDVACGRRLYILMASNGLDSVAALGDHLVRLFAMCGSLQEAALVFWKLADRTVHTWQAIISAHAVQGEHVRALEYYHIMLQEGVMPNRFIFPGVLKACGNIGALEQGELIHDKVVQCGFELDVFTGNTLVDMYAKCGCLKEAREVFDDLQQRDVVSWNAMIEGYAHRGHSSPALEFFQRMQQEGIKPSRASFLGALKACWMAGDIKQGRQIHEQIRECGLHLDTAVRNTLIYMYAKCGTLEMAGKLFNESKAQDVVSWNAIMVGVQQHGNAQAALELFDKMQEKGIKPDKITFSCVLKACSSVGALEQGKMVHKKLMGSGYESDTAICSALVDMYAKCGSLEEARTLFDNLPARDIVSWGAIITGYAQRGDGVVALDLFDKMQDEGIMPNRVVLLCAVKACCSVGAIAQGKLIHGEVIGNGLESDVMIGSTLIEMYARCGCLEEACEVFLELPDKDVIAWGVMIGAYAQHGKSGLAVQCLKDMQEQGLRPDGMIYTTILTSCSHAGQVEEGQQLFKSMRELHGIFPDVEHLNCMADLLGRTGHLYEAEELLEIMPIPPVLSGWMSLLSACRAYGNVNLGRECFDQVVSLDANYSASYVVMSNIYADAQMWDNAHKLRNSRKCASAWRKPGRAWIEVNRKIHEFTVGDKTHPASVDIYAKSNELRMAMKQEGYVPQLALVLDSVSEEDKEEALFGHCEKLAICFGLLVTAKGATIRVTKNLRVCRDCHNASKIISKIENRQIIISDSYRVHNFEEGVCSCGDVF